MERNLPQLKSERLSLRLLNEGEEAAAIEYWGRDKDHLMPSGPKWPDDFLSEEFWRLQIARNKREFDADFSVRTFVFEPDDPVPVGHASLGAILRGPAQFCYLGYGLSSSRQGRGYMTEILPELIKYGFEDLKLHRIMANYMPTNDRSGRLLKRLGFTIEGYARDYLFLNGKWEDHIMTSLTNTNWSD